MIENILSIVFIVVFFTLMLAESVLFSTHVKSQTFSVNYLSTGLNYVYGLSGFENLPNIDFSTPTGPSFDENEKDNCQKGLFISIYQNPVDCDVVCNSGVDTYEYKFIENEITLNDEIYQGAYCMPTTLARCNLYTSWAIWGNGQYKCVPKWPYVFGGPGGNNITSCVNGRIYDALTDNYYSYNIPSNLYVDDINEKITKDGESIYRFSCVPGKNENSNKMLEKPDSFRFDYIENKCADTIFAVDETKAYPNFNQGKCVCESPYVYNEAFCSMCRNGIGESPYDDLPGHKIGYVVSKPCLGADSLVNSVGFACANDTVQLNRYCEYTTLPISNTYSTWALDKMEKGKLDD